MKRNWVLITIIVGLLAITYPLVFKNKPSIVTINGKNINVELATTDKKRTKGLSGRSTLSLDTGMLFIFPQADRYTFWMKDTLIPLDIIYINNNTIVDITTLQPQHDENIPQYSSKEKVNYVLELNANSDFKIGDKVKIKY